MTDKELIKQEIERRLSNLWHLIPEGEKVLRDNFTKEDANNLGKYTALESILQFIDSLSEEPASEDLEEEIERCWKEMFPTGWSDYTLLTLTYEQHRAFAHHYAEWQKQQMKEALQTEYEKGRFDMREEMMKALVNGDVVKKLNNQLCVDSEPIKDTFGDLKFGDKVKIIIIKED